MPSQIETADDSLDVVVCGDGDDGFPQAAPEIVVGESDSQREIVVEPEQGQHVMEAVERPVTEESASNPILSELDSGLSEVNFDENGSVAIEENIVAIIDVAETENVKVAEIPKNSDVALEAKELVAEVTLAVVDTENVTDAIAGEKQESVPITHESIQQQSIVEKSILQSEWNEPVQEVLDSHKSNPIEVRPSIEDSASSIPNSNDDWGDFTATRNDKTSNSSERRPSIEEKTSSESNNNDEWSDFTANAGDNDKSVNFEASFDEQPTENNDDWGDFTTDDQKGSNTANDDDWSGFTKPAVAVRTNIFELPAAELQEAISKCLSNILPEKLVTKASYSSENFVRAAGVTFESLLQKTDESSPSGSLSIEIDSTCIFYGSPLCDMVFSDIDGVETPIAPFQAQKRKFFLNSTPTPSACNLWQMDQPERDTLVNDNVPEIPDLSYMTSTTLKE